MKYILEVANNKSEIAEEFFKSVSFIKDITPLAENEITNPLILKSIEDYEKRKLKPTPLSLKELKEMINA